MCKKSQTRAKGRKVPGNICRKRDATPRVRLNSVSAMPDFGIRRRGMRPCLVRSRWLGSGGFRVWGQSPKTHRVLRERRRTCQLLHEVRRHELRWKRRVQVERRRRSAAPASCTQQTGFRFSGISDNPRMSSFSIKNLGGRVLGSPGGRGEHRCHTYYSRNVTLAHIAYCANNVNLIP